MKKEDAHKRLLQAIEYLRDNGQARKQADIAAAMSANRANVANAMRGNPKYITESFLKRFADAYSDYINEEWLLTGEGEMEIRDEILIPHYSAKASAGFMDGISEGEMSPEMRAMVIPVLQYDFSIDASGQSMMPRIEDGDTLLCLKATDRLNPPLEKICVIDTKDGAVVKIIKDVDENEGTMTLHSLNPEYKDYSIDLSDINGIAIVVGLIRNFA